jgi:hypothetical protein
MVSVRRTGVVLIVLLGMVSVLLSGVTRIVLARMVSVSRGRRMVSVRRTGVVLIVPLGMVSVSRGRRTAHGRTGPSVTAAAEAARNSGPVRARRRAATATRGLTKRR